MGVAGEQQRSVDSGARSRTLRTALIRAIDRHPASAARLVHANTSVRFELDDEPDVTLLLDRDPPRVAGPDEPAETTITLRGALGREFAAGRLGLTGAIVDGSAHATGPVRSYLEADPIIRTMLQAESRIASRGPHPRGVPGPVAEIDSDLLAIETRDLHKRFGSAQVLEGLNLRIPEGVISVLLGPSGTGKSVCLQHLIGLLHPDSGDVLIRGNPLSKMGRSELLGLRRSIGVMFQDGALFSALNVHENVAFPLRQHTDFTEAEIDEAVNEHLVSVGLGDAGRRMPSELSGGMRKRAGLARALALNPGIVLVDEPDSGLDPVRTALLGELLIDRHADHGGTMVVVTHNVMLARSIAEHISVLWQGKVLESGMASQVLGSETPFLKQFLAGSPEGPLSMDA